MNCFFLTWLLSISILLKDSSALQHVSVWYVSLTGANKNNLSRVVRTAEEIAGCRQKSLHALCNVVVRESLAYS